MVMIFLPIYKPALRSLICSLPQLSVYFNCTIVHHIYIKLYKTFLVYVRSAKVPTYTYDHWYINTYSYNEFKLTRARGTLNIVGVKREENQCLTFPHIPPGRG